MFQDENMTYGEYVRRYIPPEEWTDYDRQTIAAEEVWRDADRRRRKERRRVVLGLVVFVVGLGLIVYGITH